MHPRSVFLRRQVNANLLQDRIRWHPFSPSTWSRFPVSAFTMPSFIRSRQKARASSVYRKPGSPCTERAASDAEPSASPHNVHDSISRHDDTSFAIGGCQIICRPLQLSALSFRRINRGEYRRCVHSSRTRALSAASKIIASGFVPAEIVERLQAFSRSNIVMYSHGL